PELGWRMVEDAQAAAAPDARPVRLEEGPVEPPRGLPVDDLLHVGFLSVRAHEQERKPPLASTGVRSVELVTTGVAAGGDGLAREDDGRVVFVPGALPGER